MADNDAVFGPAPPPGQRAIPFWDNDQTVTLGNGEQVPGYNGAIYADNPWDVVTIGGAMLPGRCEVRASPRKKRDKKSPAGKDGATSTVHGQDTVEVDISVLIWMPQQWTRLYQILQVIWQPAQKGPAKAYAIYHPALEALNIRSVQVLGVGTPVKGEVHGSKVFQIKCEQYEPPGKVVATSTPRQAGLIARRDPAKIGQPPVQQPNVNYQPANANQSLPSQDPSVTGPAL